MHTYLEDLFSLRMDPSLSTREDGFFFTFL